MVRVVADKAKEIIEGAGNMALNAKAAYQIATNIWKIKNTLSTIIPPLVLFAMTTIYSNGYFDNGTVDILQNAEGNLVSGLVDMTGKYGLVAASAAAITATSLVIKKGQATLTRAFTGRLNKEKRQKEDLIYWTKLLTKSSNVVGAVVAGKIFKATVLHGLSLFAAGALMTQMAYPALGVAPA